MAHATRSCRAPSLSTSAGLQPGKAYSPKPTATSRVANIIMRIEIQSISPTPCLPNRYGSHPRGHGLAAYRTNEFLQNRWGGQNSARCRSQKRPTFSIPCGPMTACASLNIHRDVSSKEDNMIGKMFGVVIAPWAVCTATLLAGCALDMPDNNTSHEGTGTVRQAVCDDGLHDCDIDLPDNPDDGDPDDSAPGGYNDPGDSGGPSNPRDPNNPGHPTIRSLQIRPLAHLLSAWMIQRTDCSAPTSRDIDQPACDPGASHAEQPRAGGRNAHRARTGPSRS
jgi:hypothetical protein